MLKIFKKMRSGPLFNKFTRTQLDPKHARIISDASSLGKIVSHHQKGQLATKAVDKIFHQSARNGIMGTRRLNEEEDLGRKGKSPGTTKALWLPS